MPAGWEPSQSSYPLPPQNGQVLSSFTKGSLDIRWDNPAILSGNSSYAVVGVNIYRSTASDRGPYIRLNDVPLGSTFYRDRTDYQFVDHELINPSSWVFQGDKPNDRKFVFKTQNRVVKRDLQAPYQSPVFANAPSDVTLYYNGEEVPVHEVFGRTGEITLINIGDFNVVTEKIDGPAIPFAEDDIFEISYWTPHNFVPSGLEYNLWYRLTTVVLTEDSTYIETPLSQCKPLSLVEIETIDWIWKEAVRRNAWILFQGGERVKVFVRKVCGTICDCTRDTRTLEYSKQPENRCFICFGTGFIGGYEGPYDIIIAPDDAERRLSQSSFGRRKEHSYEVWTGPTPLLTQRDLVVKQTNERYSIGPVRRPSNRGNLLQQHFNIAYLDEGDIRYMIPIDGTTDLPWPANRPYHIVEPRTPVTGERSIDEEEGWVSETYPEGPYSTMPMESDNPNTTDSIEQRGRSETWRNQNY